MLYLKVIHIILRVKTFCNFIEFVGDKTCVICMDDFSSNQLLQHVFKSKHSLGSLDDTGRCNAPMCEVLDSIFTYHCKN